MATLNLPTWFDVYECEAALVPEVRGFAGPFGGPTELQDLLGDRWRLRLTLPDGDFNHGGRTEALFNRLRGGADWLRLYHFAKPAPRGTARGAMVLGATVAQGANTLVINRVVNSAGESFASFEPDTDANGRADGVTAYSQGTTGSVSYMRSTSPVVDGVYSQTVNASGIGTNAADRAGFSFDFIGVLSGASQTISAAVWVRGTVGVRGTIIMQALNAAGTVVDSAQTTVTMSLAYQDVVASSLVPAGAVSVRVFCYIGDSTVGVTAAFGDFDALQISLASTRSVYAGRPTLRAGDMLGHNGEQLFQVYEDATANDAGVITVTTVNRARKAIASGQTIVWDKPNIPFQLLDATGVPTAYTRGRARGQQVEFVEAWQA